MSEFIMKPADEEIVSAWDSLIESAEGGTPYHRWRWLEAMAENSGMRFLPLVCWQGQSRPIGLFPVFFKALGGLRAIYSPPPGCSIPYLGPVLATTATRTKDREALVAGMTGAFCQYCKERRIDLQRILLPPCFHDVRSFSWNNYTARPHYTYRVPIDGQEEEILKSFQSETRTKIRRAKKYDDLEIIRCESPEAIRKIHRLTAARYSEQGISWRIKDDYVVKAMTAFQMKDVSAFLVNYRDNPISGMLSFRWNDSFIDWIGGIHPTESLSGVNELLHWEILRHAKSQGCKWYDLGGANTPHISKAKSKFSPDIQTFFSVERSSLKGRMVGPAMQSPRIKKYLKRIACS